MRQVKQNTKSLHNLFIDSITPQENRKVKIKNSASMNQQQIHKNLFVVEPKEDRSFIVNSDPMSPQRRSPDFTTTNGSRDLSPQDSLEIQGFSESMLSLSFNLLFKILLKKHLLGFKLLQTIL